MGHSVEDAAKNRRKYPAVLAASSLLLLIFYTIAAEVAQFQGVRILKMA
jgi:hypothetical protein